MDLPWIGAAACLFSTFLLLVFNKLTFSKNINHEYPGAVFLPVFVLAPVAPALDLLSRLPVSLGISIAFSIASAVGKAVVIPVCLRLRSEPLFCCVANFT